VLAVPLGLLAVVYTIVPISIALTGTHKYREPIGSPPSADYREVHFDATDGVDISAWYRPTQNGATIIVLHGRRRRPHRRDGPRQAACPARLRRAAPRRPRTSQERRRSDQNAYGWGWPNDIAGAIRFLKTREEARPPPSRRSA
jgi:hypothetical protein